MKKLLSYRDWTLLEIRTYPHEEYIGYIIFKVKGWGKLGKDHEYQERHYSVNDIMTLINKYKDDPFRYLYFPEFLRKIVEKYPEHFI